MNKGLLVRSDISWIDQMNNAQYKEDVGKLRLFSYVSSKQKLTKRHLQFMLLNYQKKVTLLLSNHYVKESLNSNASYLFRRKRMKRKEFANKIFSRKLENYAIFIQNTRSNAQINYNKDVILFDLHAVIYNIICPQKLNNKYLIY